MPAAPASSASLIKMPHADEIFDRKESADGEWEESKTHVNT